MTDNNILDFEKVYVIEPLYNDFNVDVDELINESKSLIESADGVFAGSIVVKIREITPSTYIGSGKLMEIKEIIESLGVNTVLFDGTLSPSQTLNVSDALNVKVIDRTTLILDIFAKNAKSHEGKLQVELAQLSYLYPRLKGKGQELSRLGGGIGTRGPGETQLETDRRHIKSRIDNLKIELEEVKKRRQVQAYRRTKNSEIVISLVGYTNTGKSTLLNLLTGANVLAKNQLFATLDPTIRRANIGDFEVLLVDTVGFIKNIPTNIVESFKSTLESALSAQLNLIVVDGSGSWETQLKVTLDTLKELNSNNQTQIVVNKCDMVSDYTLFPKDAVFISAKTGFGIDNLLEKITEKLSEMFIKTKLQLKYNELSEFSKLLGYLENFEYEYYDDYIYVDVIVKKIHFDKFIKFKKIFQ